MSLRFVILLISICSNWDRFSYKVLWFILSQAYLAFFVIDDLQMDQSAKALVIYIQEDHYSLYINYYSDLIKWHCVGSCNNLYWQLCCFGPASGSDSHYINFFSYVQKVFFLTDCENVGDTVEWETVKGLLLGWWYHLDVLWCSYTSIA